MKKIFLLSIILLLLAPAVVLAQVNTTQPSGLNLPDKILGCDATSGVACVIKNILLILLAIAFIVAVIFLVIGGFRYIVSQGNEEAVEKAKGTITNAIIGLAVITLSWIILQIVYAFVNEGNVGNL